ncbi:MAG: hypothetical protein IT305_07175 [Chloroflexi bacterium]|nr:hypothetical protein [Chloroflexota bacterium]
MIRGAASAIVARPARLPLALAAGWRHAAVTAVLFVCACLVLNAEARTAGFEADEADYVATSRYFGYLFLQHDVSRDEWGSNHWTRTQPPLTRYIVGAWLTAHGHDLETMNQPYVSTASSFEVNRRKGRVPSDDVLAIARQPMVLLGAGAMALLYPLGLLLGGPVAGLTAVSLALSSAFLRYTFVHVWAEAPLAFFLLLSALLAAVGARRTIDGRVWSGWAIGLGLALGLASATKLTGLAGLPLIVVSSALLAAGAWRRGEGHTVRMLIGWSGLACIVALVVFVAVNPFLWRGPMSGLVGMVQERREEMAFQQQQWPEFAVLDARDRPWLTLVGSTRIGPWSETPAVAVPLGAGLAVLGIVTLALRWHTSHPARRTASTMLLVWLVGYLAVIVAGLGLSYPRYFLPACLLLLPWLGAGMSALVGGARRVAPLLTPRPPLPRAGEEAGG